MKKDKKIERLVAKFNDPITRLNMMKDRQERIIKLIEKHGFDNVALASGYSMATLKAYSSTKMPNIGLDGLTQAEAILKLVDEEE